MIYVNKKKESSCDLQTRIIASQGRNVTLLASKLHSLTLLICVKMASITEHSGYHSTFKLAMVSAKCNLQKVLDNRRLLLKRSRE